VRILAAIAAALLVSPLTIASPKAQNTQARNPDRLGLTCTEILQMTSTAWVSDFTAKNGVKQDDDTSSTLRAIAAYGKCYDARTGQLAAALSKNGAGPLMGASGNFRDFDEAVKKFTAIALAITDPPAGELKSAYVALYEKQFRYEFLQAYRRKNHQPNLLTPEELEEVGNAKTQLGQELASLPADKMRELHAAFSKLFGAPISDSMKLQVYRFAIFVLEPASAKPFSPPPF
jgi:hypothetical protein